MQYKTKDVVLLLLGYRLNLSNTVKHFLAEKSQRTERLDYGGKTNILY